MTRDTRTDSEDTAVVHSMELGIINLADGTTQPKRLLTVVETAQALGVGKTLVWDLVHRGEIPSVRLGRLVRIPVQKLDEWIQHTSN